MIRYFVRFVPRVIASHGPGVATSGLPAASGWAASVDRDSRRARNCSNSTSTSSRFRRHEISMSSAAGTRSRTGSRAAAALRIRTPRHSSAAVTRTWRMSNPAPCAGRRQLQGAIYGVALQPQPVGGAGAGVRLDLDKIARRDVLQTIVASFHSDIERRAAGRALEHEERPRRHVAEATDPRPRRDTRSRRDGAVSRSCHSVCTLSLVKRRWPHRPQLRHGRAGSAHEQIRQARDDEAEADGLAPLVQDGGSRDGEEPAVVRPGVEGAAREDHQRSGRRPTRLVR